MSRYSYRVRKFLLHSILHADDTPHAIAMGVAIAMVVAFLPLVGFQTAIAVGVAALFRANKAVCVPIVWITNPFTMVPIYGACWKLGQWTTSTSTAADAMVVLAKLDQPRSTLHFYSFDFWKHKLDLLLGMGIELWVGCLIVGVVLGTVSYLVSRRGVVGYRERRRQKILKRSLFRTRPQKDRVTRPSESL